MRGLGRGKGFLWTRRPMSAGIVGVLVETVHRVLERLSGQRWVRESDREIVVVKEALSVVDIAQVGELVIPACVGTYIEAEVA